jgi:hypothetical protein
MIIGLFAVLTALCGGAVALAESRERPRRRAQRIADRASQPN